VQLKPRNFSVEDEYFAADVIKNCQKLIVIRLQLTVADIYKYMQGKPNKRSH